MPVTLPVFRIFISFLCFLQWQPFYGSSGADDWVKILKIQWLTNNISQKKIWRWGGLDGQEGTPGGARIPSRLRERQLEVAQGKCEVFWSVAENVSGKISDEVNIKQEKKKVSVCSKSLEEEKEGVCRMLLLLKC